MVIPHPTFTLFRLASTFPTYVNPVAPPKGIVVSSKSSFNPKIFDTDDSDDSDDAQKFSFHHECPTPTAFTFLAAFTAVWMADIVDARAIDAPLLQLYSPWKFDKSKGATASTDVKSWKKKMTVATTTGKERQRRGRNNVLHDTRSMASIIQKYWSF
tara:strand:- start:75 stop:545 length:471 start_codon:yes stop_codon:yes gene_type:complete